MLKIYFLDFIQYMCKKKKLAISTNCKLSTAAYKKRAFSAGKKKNGAVLVFFLYLTLCYANPSVDFFAGAGGKLAFPSASKKENGAAGVGGGGYAEGGIEFFNIQTELFTSFSYLSSSGLVERILETEIGIGASYVFSKKNIRILPARFAFRPHIGVFMDIYAADVYKNAVQKEEGALTSAHGVTAGLCPGIFFDLPNLIALTRINIIPTVGFEESIRFDRVSGIYATPLLSASVRFFWELSKKHAALPQSEERYDAEVEETEEPEEIEEIEEVKEAVEVKEVEPETPVPEETPPPKEKALPFVMFAPNSATLFAPNADTEDPSAATAESALNETAQILIENPGLNVVIIGYANSITGTAEENETELIPLSLKRAECDCSELEKRGITPARISVRGEGAGAHTSADGWKNRRVEFLLIEENKETP